MARIINYHFSVLTGGGANALDSVDGNELEDGYRAYIITAGGAFTVYWLDADYDQPENDPTIIVPDTNPGTKCWRLCS